MSCISGTAGNVRVAVRVLARRLRLWKHRPQIFHQQQQMQIVDRRHHELKVLVETLCLVVDCVDKDGPGDDDIRSMCDAL